MRGAIAIGLLLPLSLLAWLTPAAGARKPQISYVNEHGTFQLLRRRERDEGLPRSARSRARRTQREPVHVGDVPGRPLCDVHRRRGQAAPARPLSNLQVPLPGIDKVPKPANLTVSDTGLIGYDNNSNKPTYVYDSIARRFFATGLDLEPESPTNEHRQPRLSGDGSLMVTTCFDNNESTCFTTRDESIPTCSSRTW